MPKYFTQGQRILCRGEEWQVTEAFERKIANGTSVWEIVGRGLSGIVNGQEFAFIDSLEPDLEILDPADIEPVADDSKKARRSRVYLEAHLRRFLPRNGSLYLGQHGAFDPQSYQLKPAAKALHHAPFPPRLLIGDAVGLGKTIECGILLSELMRRGKAKRILCAVPKAILEQFQMELWGRFSIPFHRLDSKGLQRLRQDLPSVMNPFYHYDKVIISVDTLKLKSYQKMLENCDWDVFVVDEAHNVANRTDGLQGSLRHKVARRIAERARAVIMMSATPHDGTPAGFASLIQLLDRTVIPNDRNYTIQDIQKHFIRRTRATLKSAQGQRPERKQFLETIPMTEGEINLLQMLHDIKFESTGLRLSERTGVRELFRTTLIKSFLSSPHALKQTVENKLKRLSQSKATPSAASEQDAESLRNILAEIDSLKGKYSRFEHLKEFLKKAQISSNDRLVIFSERLETLKALKEFLLQGKFIEGIFDAKSDTQPKGSLVAIADGSLSDIELQSIVKSFQSDKNPIQILLASNVASEGLNLHQKCHKIIHFDLPWSFLTLEQRNGRIDRYGQEREPQIYYFASVAEKPTRESNLKELYDDLWIVRKLEARMNQAGQDMDEEALQNGFATSDAEEETNTRLYEESPQSLLQAKTDISSILARMMAASIGDQADASVTSRSLPSLFEESPGDFIKWAAKEIDLRVETDRGSLYRIPMNTQLRHEVGQWPNEFKPHPESNEFVFESNRVEMAKHYRDRQERGAQLDRTFLNEIHPAIAVLETAALTIFSGKHVPVIPTGALKKGSVAYLCQGTLFNKLNEVVFQSWQIVEFGRGKTEPDLVFRSDDTKPEYISEMMKWFKDQVFEVESDHGLTPFETKRVKDWAGRAVETMKKEMKSARETRRNSLRGLLTQEKARIETWVKARSQFLEEAKRTTEQASQHGGTASLRSRAEEELAELPELRAKVDKFVSNVLATSDEPNIRILAVFMGV